MAQQSALLGWPVADHCAVRMHHAPMKIPVVRFDADSLSERESQIIGMLITIREQQFTFHFAAGGHELSPEQRRHICENLALEMTSAFPDLHFFVEMLEQPEDPAAQFRPEFPR
jgi:surfactin synthase thioesterase subunit